MSNHLSIKVLRLFLLLLLANHISCAQPGKTNIPNQVPDFTFFTLDKDKAFTSNDLKINTNNIVIIFFDPGCSHCQDEIQLIGKNYNSVKDINFYLVSMQEKNLINAFMDTYGSGLRGKTNVTLLQDKNYEFIGKFNPVRFPATFVYGPDKKLKHYWDGDKKIKEIIAAVTSK